MKRLTTFPGTVFATLFAILLALLQLIGCCRR